MRHVITFLEHSHHIRDLRDATAGVYEGHQHHLASQQGLYGLRSGPKLWQRHLEATLSQLHLCQLKSDRCVWVGHQLAVLC